MIGPIGVGLMETMANATSWSESQSIVKFILYISRIYLTKKRNKIIKIEISLLCVW